MYKIGQHILKFPKWDSHSLLDAPFIRAPLKTSHKEKLSKRVFVVKIGFGHLWNIIYDSGRRLSYNETVAVQLFC